MASSSSSSSASARQPSGRGVADWRAAAVPLRGALHGRRRRRLEADSCRRSARPGPRPAARSGPGRPRRATPPGARTRGCRGRAARAAAVPRSSGPRSAMPPERKTVRRAPRPRRLLAGPSLAWPGCGCAVRPRGRAAGTSDLRDRQGPTGPRRGVRTPARLDGPAAEARRRRDRRSARRACACAGPGRGRAWVRWTPPSSRQRISGASGVAAQQGVDRLGDVGVDGDAVAVLRSRRRRRRWAGPCARGPTSGSAAGAPRRRRGSPSGCRR